VRRILDVEAPEGVERLAQEISYSCHVYEHVERDEVTLRLAVFNGRPLEFLV
jgi:hypothetical protein